MILKGSQRGGAGNLAAHLLNTHDNEHVRLHELRGFIADDLHGALRESEAISRGTKCEQHLFSLSMSPPEGERASAELFEQTANRIEKRLGLDGQPRAIVFHEKEGRRHAHCVWSRIDASTMTARPLPYFKTRLMEVSRELYLDRGWKMPRGFENAAERNPTNFTLAEWQQAKRQGVDPRWLKSTIQQSWNRSDGRRAFERSLSETSFTLARGDKRGFVVVDHTGEVHSLPRALDIKTKDVRARLGDGDDLPSVSDVQARIGARMTPAFQRHIREARAQFQQRSAKLGHDKMEMTHLHRDARAKLEERQQAEWLRNTKDRASRLPRGMRGLWHRITGKYQEVRQLNEYEALLDKARHSEERQKLIEKQLEERAALQRDIKQLRSRQAEQLLELRRDAARYLRFVRGDPPARDRSQSLDLKLGR